MIRPRAAAVALGVALLAACGAGAETTSRPTAATSTTVDVWPDCRAAAERITDAVQDYVDAFGGSAGGVDADDEALADAVADAQAAVDRLDCERQRFADTLGDGLALVGADGPVARAVRDRTVAAITGRTAEQPERLDVEPGEDLARVVAEAALGSTVALAAGTYELDETVVVLAGVTLEGSGSAETVLASSAPDAGVLVVTQDRVELSSLAIERSGQVEGSGIVAGPSASLVLTDVRVAGASGAAEQGAGAGVLLSAQGEEAAGRGTTAEVTGGEFSANEWAGFALTGGHRASILGATFDGNGECGICFLGGSDGSVQDATFADNGIGVVAIDESRPTVLDSTFAGGQVGVQAGGTAAPVLTGLSIRGAERAALVFTEEATGRIDGVECTGAEVGLAVGPAAAPALGENECELVPATD